jgi:hypothetical protein
MLPFRYGIAQKRALHLRLKRHIGDRDAIAKDLNGQGTLSALAGAKVTGGGVGSCEGAFLEHEFRPKGSQHRKNVKARLTGRFGGRRPVEMGITARG